MCEDLSVFDPLVSRLREAQAWSVRVDRCLGGRKQVRQGHAPNKGVT